MTEIETLRIEVERLRDLLYENGISPDPTPPYVAPFGPPTLMQAVTRDALAKITRIRLSNDYTVTGDHNGR